MSRKIGIVGLGTVGEAMRSVLERRGVDIIGYDKFKESDPFESLLSAEFVFLCLPTLYSEILRTYDIGAFHEVLKLLRSASYRGLVVVKSTVEPGTTQSLAEQYGIPMVHNPEFLKARTAAIDFDQQRHIIVGRVEGIDEKWVRELIEFYHACFPSAEISVCTAMESELTKLAVNSFYATKIMFFNELYFLLRSCEGAEYEVVKNLMIKNEQIHPSFTSVPGPDGSFAFGGACFPKDTKMFQSLLSKKEHLHALMDSVVSECEIARFLPSPL